MASYDNRTVFASGPQGTSRVDSLTSANGSIWAEYGNGADSAGARGSSTLVKYAQNGMLELSLTLPGSVDGLKYDAANGLLYALQNQDGNSTLTTIDPGTGKIGPTLAYAATSPTRGYDDAAFLNGKVYLSYKNPDGSADPVAAAHKRQQPVRHADHNQHSG